MSKKIETTVVSSTGDVIDLVTKLFSRVADEETEDLYTQISELEEKVEDIESVNKAITLENKELKYLNDLKSVDIKEGTSVVKKKRTFKRKNDIPF